MTALIYLMFSVIVSLLEIGFLSPLYASPPQDVPKAPKKITIKVNIPSTTLTVFENGIPVRTFRVAVGSPRYPTPTGKFHFETIIWNPGWFPPTESDWAKDAKPIPPGPGNPLGPVKFPMQQAILIHGTSNPWSIGYPRSHGCIRLKSSDATQLGTYLQSRLLPSDTHTWENSYSKKRWQTVWKNLPYSVKVDIVYEPFQMISNEILVHPNFYGRKTSLTKRLVDYLVQNEVYHASLDLEKIKNLRKIAKGHPGIIPISDLMREVSLDEKRPSFLEPVCKLSSPTPQKNSLEKIENDLDPFLIAHSE